ncbi:transposase [Alicyclobacillus herbarius]|uniref:transposase n=1 Tax=Alicyclobacillus herbarius TaxID=122960 RepID=UPI002356A694|nr:transposase [Alicyclobacillus herbarius]
MSPSRPADFTPIIRTQLIEWFASSKICSECDHQQDDMPLSVRHWACPECGTIHDRDLNAAKNLVKLAVSSTVTACGENVRPTTLVGSSC